MGQMLLLALAIGSMVSCLHGSKEIKQHEVLMLSSVFHPIQGSCLASSDGKMRATHFRDGLSLELFFTIHYCGCVKYR